MNRRLITLCAAGVVCATIALLLFVNLRKPASLLNQNDHLPPSNRPVAGSGPTNKKEQSAKADEIIARWNADTSIILDDAHLERIVELIPTSGCMTPTNGASALDVSTLSPESASDFKNALRGFLKSYAESNPETVVKYMEERGKQLDPKAIQSFTAGLVKQGELTAGNTSTPKDVYSAFWKSFNYASHWSAIVPKSSCVTFFDGKTVPLRSLKAFDFDGVNNSAYSPKQLQDVLSSTTTFKHNFLSTQGNLEQDLANSPIVACADVLLVIELNESKHRVKLPYLVRFWRNSAQQKWQPVCLACFGSHPQKSIVTLFGF